MAGLRPPSRTVARRIVRIPPLEEHWHGTEDGSRTAHVAAQETGGDDRTVTRLEPEGDKDLARTHEAAQQV